MTREASPDASEFAGFVTGGAATTLPAQFFVEVLPVIEDEAELRVTLYALYAIGRVRGALRAVRGSALAAEAPLARSFAQRGGAQAVREALGRAVERGTLLTCPLAGGDVLYFVHNEAGRRALQRVQAGAVAVPGARPLPPQPSERRARPAEVYEQEIGVITPSISDALGAAAERWPEQWVIEAIRLAAKRNARSWRYAEVVLERWEAEGRDDATTGAAPPGATPGRDHGPYEKVIRRS